MSQQELTVPRAIDMPLGQRVDPTDAEEGYPITVDIQSSSDEDTVYQVVVHDSNGFAICGCKGFLYRGRCRHTKEAVAKVAKNMSKV